MDFKRAADKETKHKGEYTIKEFRDLGDERGDAVTTVVCVDTDGRELVKLVLKDKECVSQEATTDAQDSGLFEDVAKKFGIKKEDLKYTKASLAIARAGNESEKATKKQGTGHDPLGEKAELLKKSTCSDCGCDQCKCGLKKSLEFLKKCSARSKSTKMLEKSDVIQCKCGLKKSLEFLKKCSARCKSTKMLEKGDVIQGNFGKKKPTAAESSLPEPSSPEDSARLKRIHHSLKTISSLMAELKAEQNKPKGGE